MSVHLLVTRREAECLEDALKSFTSKAQESTKKELLKQLNQLLRGGKPKPDGWAPIRSSWPSGAISKRSTHSNSYFKKPRASTEKSAKPAKKPLTAQEILNSL
jgi:hypothetical protein